MDLKVLLFLAGLAIVLGGVTCSGRTDACYLGWGYRGEWCYKVFRSPESWVRAQKVCENNGGDLLELFDQAEKEFVSSLLESSLERFWVGARVMKNGRMQWRAGSDVKLPHLLGSGQPPGPNCGTLSAPSNGSIDPRNCQDSLQFICKAKPFECNVDYDWHVTKSQHCLWFSDSTKTGSWHSIRQNCHSFNSDLATFSNPSDASLLPSILRGNVPYWVGLWNNPSTFDPMWLDGVNEKNSSRFPLVSGLSPSQQCGCVTLNDKSDLQWRLENCSKPKQFICERTVPKVLTTPMVPQTTYQQFKTGRVSSKHDTTDTQEKTTYVSSSSTTSIPEVYYGDVTSQIATEGKWHAMRLLKRLGEFTLTRMRRALDPQPPPHPELHPSPHPRHGPHHPHKDSPHEPHKDPPHEPHKDPPHEPHRDPPHSSPLPYSNPDLNLHPLSSPDPTLVTNSPSGLHSRPTAKTITPVGPSHPSSPPVSPAGSDSDKDILPSQRAPHAARNNHPHNNAHLGHHTWHLRATGNDCCIRHASQLVCTRLSSQGYYSSIASFPPCNDSTTVSASQATTAHAHTDNRILTTSPVSSAVSTTASSVTMTQTTEKTQLATWTVSRDTTEITPYTTTVKFQENSDGGDLELSILANLNLQIQKLCPGSDDPYVCLNEHVQNGGLSNTESSLSLHDLFQGLMAVSSINQSKLSKLIFKNFFKMVNFFIEGSYSSSWHTYNLSLTDVISTVEPFLTRNIEYLDPDEDIEESFSKVDIFIKRMKRRDVGSFRFDSPDNIGHIGNLNLTTQVHADVTVAVVLMKVPVIHVDLENQRAARNLTGLVVSPILSLSGYSKGRPLSLSHDFSLNQTRVGIKKFPLQENETTASPLTCSFWNNYTREWSSSGCSMTPSDDMTSYCHCNHTTSFAILMQVHYFEPGAVDRVALEIITYIGCSVALITQVIAITVFTFVGSLNSERVYVHRNLCIAIVGAQVTFLAGIDAVENKLVCAIVAVALHYFYTAVFIWMLVEGLHLYSKVVQVFGTERSRTLYYMTFGWGVPVILVAISAAADWEGYGTKHSCWLSTTRRTIWAFVGPAMAIVIVNLVILAMVVKIVMLSSRRHGEFAQIRAGIKGALSLLPLLGLTWVFGLAAVNEELIIFQYLFAIFNSLQGFFIFLFHCAFNTEVRQALRRLKVKRSLQKGDLSVSSGSQVGPIPMSDAWASARPDRKYPSYSPNQVAPLATRGTTTTRLNSLSQSKESDDLGCQEKQEMKEDNEEISFMYI